MAINTTIRQATIADIEIIAEYNSRIAQETERLQLDLARVRAGVAALVRDAAKGTYYVAELSTGNGLEIGGQLLITYEWSDWRNGTFWWIQSVYVAERFRGAGIFRSLFRHVHALAKARQDVCGLRLYMDAHNSVARQTYERLGLKRTNYEVFEMDFVLNPSH